MTQWSAKIDGMRKTKQRQQRERDNSKKEEADGLTFKVKENYWAMLKFGASQHFQEVSHEPPGTERGEKSVGDEGMGVGVVRACVYVCVSCMCVWCVRGDVVGVGDHMRGGCWNGVVEVCPG